MSLWEKCYESNYFTCSLSACVWEAEAGSRAGCDRRLPEETCMANGSREGKSRCSPKGSEMWLWHTSEGSNLERSKRGELISSNTGRQFTLRAKHAAKETGVAQTCFFLLSLCPPAFNPHPIHLLRVTRCKQIYLGWKIYLFIFHPEICLGLVLFFMVTRKKKSHSGTFNTH